MALLPLLFPMPGCAAPCAPALLPARSGGRRSQAHHLRPVGAPGLRAVAARDSSGDGNAAPTLAGLGGWRAEGAGQRGPADTGPMALTRALAWHLHLCGAKASAALLLLLADVVCPCCLWHHALPSKHLKFCTAPSRALYRRCTARASSSAASCASSSTAPARSAASQSAMRASTSCAPGRRGITQRWVGG